MATMGKCIMYVKGGGLFAEENSYGEPVTFVVHGEIFQLYACHVIRPT